MAKMLIFVIFKKLREYINDFIVVFGYSYKQPFGGNFDVTENIYGAN